MQIEPRFSTFIVSAISGYWIAFVASFIVVTLMESEVSLVLFPIFLFSLFFAVGVAISASIFGYPIFKIIFQKLKVSIVPKLLISGACSCAVSVVAFAIAFNYFIGGNSSFSSALETSAGLLTFCVVVIPFSALTYWFIEK